MMTPTRSDWSFKFSGLLFGGGKLRAEGTAVGDKAGNVGSESGVVTREGVMSVVRKERYV